MNDPAKVESIVLMSRDSTAFLNERQVISYKSHREDYIKWLARMGKSPNKLEGYAHDTAKVYANVTDKFHRWAWEHRGGYTLDLEHTEAERYLREMMLADEEYSSSYLHNVKLGLKTLYRFRSDADEWEPDVTIESPSGANQPKDFVNMEERKALREAALEFGTVPTYKGLNPESREKWKKYLGRRFGKPMNEVGIDDFKRANGFKYPSIVHASLDAGLRPIEVGRAKTYWLDFDKKALTIPADESSKNEDNWTVSLRGETMDYLSRWVDEREMYDKYEGTDDLWLTRHGNPYSSSSLKYILDELCEIAGIERSLSWYAIRHSTGTYMTREEDLAAAQSQLRHKSSETTMKYDNISVEDRRDALDRMG